MAAHGVIFIGRLDEHLELEEQERMPEHLPTAGDVRIRVTVKLHDFQGSYSEVWLARSDLANFVNELRNVVQMRKGTATLEAMSPGELSIELRSVGSSGHFEASVQVGRYQYSGRTYWPTKISGGFEVDPDQLPSILAGFETLLGSREDS